MAKTSGGVRDKAGLLYVGNLSNGRVNEIKEKTFVADVKKTYKRELAAAVARLKAIGNYVSDAPTDFLVKTVKESTSRIAIGDNRINDYIAEQINNFRTLGNTGQINIFGDSHAKMLAMVQARYKFIPQMRAELKKRGINI